MSARGGLSTASAFGFAVAMPPVERAGGRRTVECWTVTAAEIDAWLKIALTGETFTYAHGPALIQGGAAARVTRLAEAKEVIPHHIRSGDGGFDFIIRRNRVRLVSARAPVIDPHMMAVLLVIQDAAQNGERCPSDAAIGEQADLSPDQVKWQIRKLDEAKFIERRVVATPSEARFRVVRIVATGAETAKPTGVGCG